MPYIGQSPSTGQFIELDALTASATDTYTLQLNSANFAPESVNNLIVSINGVVQKPSSMSLNGSSLTVGATLSSSDTIDYVRVLGHVGSVVTPTDGSVTAPKIASNAVTDAKLATSLDFQNITIKGGSTNAMTVDSSGHVSHPARPYFSVRQNDGQSLVSGTQTTMLHPTSISERGSDYNSGTGAFTAPITGLYHFSADVQISSSTQWQFFYQHSNSGGSSIRSYVGFNGSSGEKTTIASQSLTIQMTATDTMLIRVTHFLGSNQNVYGHFHGFFIG